ncbi:hypothetical protein HDU67_004973 [Dinochytrium kinnereticum]|nr:hypothetical protein HDU67_004973 [Dinochytrium kinnereticum]
MATTNTSFRDAISMVLGASVPLGMHNLAICIRQAYQSRTWINIVQCVASFFQLVNQVGQILLFTQPADVFFKNDCRTFSSIADIFFFTYQLLSVIVLITRTTGLTPKKHQLALRLLFTSALLTAIAFILHSAITKTTLTTSNRCEAIYNRQSNIIGKIILFCVYFALLLVFTVPALKHVRANRRNGFGNVGATGYLAKLVMSVSIRIWLAIVGFLLTVVLSFAGVWGDYFFIEFTVQNYLGITASTFDSSTDAGGSSSGGARSGGAAAAVGERSHHLSGNGNGGLKGQSSLPVWDHPTSNVGQSVAVPKKLVTSGGRRQETWEEADETGSEIRMVRRGDDARGEDDSRGRGNAGGNW